MGCEPAILLVTDALLMPGNAVLWALQNFEDKAAAGSGLAVATGFDGKLKQAAASLDAVISLASTPGCHSVEVLRELARVVKSGGVLVVQEPGTQEAQAALKKNLLLAGLVSIDSMEPVNISGDSSLQPAMLRAQKPTWQTGSSFSIKKKTPLQNAVVKLDTSFDDEDDDLVDEDELLTEEDLKRPELPAADDCEVGKAGRKACKNCTCGRAEVEAGKASEELLNNPKSACGNCGLGDAFRCGTCPYRGLPTFKLGEKISLSGTLLTADV